MLTLIAAAGATLLALAGSALAQSGVEMRTAPQAGPHFEIVPVILLDGPEAQILPTIIPAAVPERRRPGGMLLHLVVPL